MNTVIVFAMAILFYICAHICLHIVVPGLAMYGVVMFGAATVFAIGYGCHQLAARK